MHHKQIASSWLGLGIILCALNWGTHFLLMKLGFPFLVIGFDVPIVNYLISGLLGAFLFTRYLKGALLTQGFKIKALATAIALDLLIQIAYIVLFIVKFSSIRFKSFSPDMLFADIIFIIMHILFWYPFVTFGNGLAVIVLKQKNS